MTIETRLAEIRARVDAATEGPWTAEYSGEQGNCVLPPGYQSTREAVAVTRLLSAQADAEFIAASRTDLPALLAAIMDALDVENERLPSGSEGDDWYHAGWHDAMFNVKSRITAALEVQG